MASCAACPCARVPSSASRVPIRPAARPRPLSPLGSPPPPPPQAIDQFAALHITLTSLRKDAQARADQASQCTAHARALVAEAKSARAALAGRTPEVKDTATVDGAEISDVVLQPTGRKFAVQVDDKDAHSHETARGARASRVARGSPAGMH
jgi:hypothetical protein